MANNMNTLTLNNITALMNGATININSTTPDEVLYYTELDERDIPFASDPDYAGYATTPCYDREGNRLGIYVETYYWNPDWDPDEYGCPDCLNGPEYLIPISSLIP